MLWRTSIGRCEVFHILSDGVSGKDGQHSSGFYSQCDLPRTRYRQSTLNFRLRNDAGGSVHSFSVNMSVN